MSRIHKKELRVRLTEKEYAQVIVCADTCGLTISAYIRKLLHNQPLIQRPTQGAVEHFQTLQGFQREFISILEFLPCNRQEQLKIALEKLLREGKQLI